MEAFQADRFEDLVGTLSSKCIEGLEDTELASREEHLTAILPSQNDAPVQQGEAAEQDDDDEVEGDRRSVAGSDAELKITPAGGRRVGLKGRIFTIDATVWNIVSPTGVPSHATPSPPQHRTLHLVCAVVLPCVWPSKLS